MTSGKYQKISLACTRDMMEAFANFLLTRCKSGLVVDDGRQNGFTVLTAYLPPHEGPEFTEAEIESFFAANRGYFPGADYRLVSLEHVKAQDWLAEWKKTFVPIHVTEKIIVRPTWKSCHVRPDEVEIVIDPKMAFGTGHHETTAQCLMAFEKIGLTGKRVLDYGCGSGILAIAAAKMGAARVIACDIDPEAIAAARENFSLNEVKVELIEAGNYVSPQPCDVIAANLSIDQIIKLFAELDNSLKPGGALIFSGIPLDDRSRLLGFLAEKPYAIMDELKGNEWISYIGVKQ